MTNKYTSNRIRNAKKYMKAYCKSCKLKKTCADYMNAEKAVERFISHDDNGFPSCETCPNYNDVYIKNT